MLLKDPSHENSRMERLRAWPWLCAPLWKGPGWLQKGSGGWRLKLLLTAAFDDSPAWLPLNSRAVLCSESRDCVFFCVQCKIWWKRASFLLLLLGLCQHHLSWPTSISLSFPSALTRISSPITCDSRKCSAQPWCRLAGFCSQRSSAPLNLKLALPCSLQLLL